MMSNMNGPGCGPGRGRGSGRFHRRASRMFDFNSRFRRPVNDGRGLYRSRNGKILGVCKGIADYFGFSVTGVRILAVILLIFSGLWPAVGLYFLAALIMQPEPTVPFEGPADKEFYDSWSASKESGLARLKRKFDRLDKRIRRMEDRVTSKDFDWERRYKS